MLRPLIVLAVMLALLVLKVAGNTQKEKDTEGDMMEETEDSPRTLDDLLNMDKERELKMLKQLEKGMDKLPEADRVALENRIAEIEKLGDDVKKPYRKAPIRYETEKKEP